MVKFIVTFIPYVILIGNSLGHMIFDSNREVSLLDSFTLGFLVQTFNLFIFYVIDSITFGFIDSLFQLLIPLLTAAEFLVSLLYNQKNGKPFIKLKIDDPSYAVFIAFIFQIVSFVVLGSLIAPDASLYCDIARYVNQTGNLGSLIFNDGFSNPYASSLALIPHIGTALGFSFSFFLGGINRIFAELFTLILGSVTIGLIIKNLEEWPRFVKSLILLLLILLPTFLLYSTSIFGPSMFSVFATFSALTFYNQAIQEDDTSSTKMWFLVITGFCIYIEYFVWSGTQLPLLVAIGLMTVFDLKRKEKLSSVSFLIALIVIGGLAFLPRISANIQNWIILTTLYLIIIGIIRFRKVTPIQDISILSVTTIIFFQLSYIRSYLHPEIYLVGVNHSIITSHVVGIIPTIGSQFQSFYYLIYYIPLILILLMIPGILKIKNYSHPIIALAGGYFFFQFVGRPLFTIAESRFYIGFAFTTITLAIFGCWQLIETFVHKKNKIVTRFESISKSKRIQIVVLVIIGMLMITQNTGQYIQNRELAAKYDPNQNGVQTIQSWFNDNSAYGDKILVMGSSRYWAWFLNRVTIGFHFWSNGSLISESQMNVTHLINLIVKYNATFLLIDTSSLWTRRWPNLSIIYDSPEIGKSFMIQNSTISFSLRCEKISDASSNNGTIIIFSISKNANVVDYYREDFNKDNQWKNSTNSYPLESGDSFEVYNGYLHLNFQGSGDWDFDRVYSNNISISQISTVFQTRFRVNSDSVAAVYFTFTQEPSMIGNWVQSFYLNPEPGTWITMSEVLSELLQKPDRHSEQPIQRIECIGITALLRQGGNASIEIDYVHVGSIRIQNENELTEEDVIKSSPIFIRTFNILSFKILVNSIPIYVFKMPSRTNSSYWRYII